MGLEICQILWFLTLCIHPHARNGLSFHLERTDWCPKAPFLLDSAKVGTANVCLHDSPFVCFLCWVSLISWYFLFQICLFIRTGCSPVLLTCESFFCFLHGFVHLCFAPLKVDITLDFSMGNLFPFPNTWEVKTSLNSQVIRNTQILSFLFLAWFVHNLAWRNWDIFQSYVLCP